MTGQEIIEWTRGYYAGTRMLRCEDPEHLDEHFRDGWTTGIHDANASSQRQVMTLEEALEQAGLWSKR